MSTSFIRAGLGTALFALLLGVFACDKLPDARPWPADDAAPWASADIDAVDTPSAPASPICAPPVDAVRARFGEGVTVAFDCAVRGPGAARLSVVAVEADAPLFPLPLEIVDLAPGDVFTVALELRPTEPAALTTWPVALHTLSEGLEDTVVIEVPGEVLPARPAWNAPPAVTCALEAGAPLLDDALALTGLEQATFGFTEQDLAESWYFANGFLDDAFVLPWFVDARAQVARTGCLEGELVRPLDAALAGAHPAADMIRFASARLGHAPSQVPPPDPWALPTDFDGALAELCEVAGDCGALWNELPPDLEIALVPVLLALKEAITARAAMTASDPLRDPDWWTAQGGYQVLIALGGDAPDPRDPADRAYLLGGEPRARLYDAAARLAFAIEQVDWQPFVGLRGVRFDLPTAAGDIRVRDGANTPHLDDGQALLLLIDLGGDDRYLAPVGANRSGANPVSVAIDLAGNDDYGYTTVRSRYDGPGLLPSDAADARYAGDGTYGPLSLSEVSRQGAARNGVAMLFDLGVGDDHYRSLRASQGYAHQGVGVLFDGGGNDEYAAEAAAQGAAQYGIGIAIDAGAGRDTRRAFNDAQGFGFVGGVGIVVDGGGDDVWSCDHGDPQQGGLHVYASPQMPTSANNSFCQGAGFGMRGQELATHLSGGLGILRDQDGNDVYEAGVFAQGTGYWQGTGLLSDGGGDDVYDAYWYVQGAAAHYAIGMLADAGDGADRYDTTRDSVHMNLGSGHDYSVGVLIDEGGDDQYAISSLAVGASNCNGVGLFVDNAGDDTYQARSDYGSGMGNVSTECIDARPDAVSIGVMIDAGGADLYDYPDSAFPKPSEQGELGARAQRVAERARRGPRPRGRERRACRERRFGAALSFTVPTSSEQP